MNSVIQEFADVLPGLAQRYDHLRAESVSLNSEVMKTFDKGTLLRAAEMLGMLQGETIVADLDIGAALIPEFAMYGVFAGGENVLQRFRRTHPQTDPVRQMILDAKSQAIFTLAGVVETYPAEHALVVEDLFLNNRRMLLADRSLSAGASPGNALCLRMFQVDKFWMSTGLGLSLGVNVGTPELMDYIAASEIKDMRADPDSQDLVHGWYAAMVIKTVLARHFGGSEFDDDDDVPEENYDEPLQSQRVERNAPCPCGSGKKYKKCCGR